MSTIVTIAKGAAITGFGMGEGFTFAMCGICNPEAFRDQMEFKNFLLMKVFLSGVGFSMLSQSALDKFGAVGALAKTRSYSNMRVPYSRSVVGCLMLGAGMYVAGSGPTMLPSQLFVMVGSGPAIFAGMLAGAAVYSLIEDLLDKKDSNSCVKADPSTTSLDGMAGKSYASLAAPIGAALVTGALGFEALFPHSLDVAQHRSSNGGYGPEWALNPIIAGAVVGLNQIPLRLITSDGQGGSTSVMRILATVTGGKLGGKYSIKTFSNICQPLYVYVGTSAGAYLAWRNYYAHPDGSGATGYSSLVSFTGGALMLFGARYAKGCTCGHGISGMSELSVTSIAGGMSIFAGGIATGVVHRFWF